MQRTAHMGSLSTPVISHVNFSKDSPTTHNITNLPRGKYVVCGEAYSEGIIYQAGCTEIIVEKLETKSKIMNTPGTRGWSRLRENDLFFWGKKKLPKKNIFILHISSSYAKILGETNFHAREIPLSG